MPHQLKLSIACVNYAISCPDAAILGEPDPSYRSFLGMASEEPEAIDIEIRLELGNMPSTRNLTTIFDTGRSWAMSSGGDSYCLTFNPPRLAGQPLWLARIARDLTRVTVYCSEKMIHTTQAGVAVANPVRYPLDQILLMYVLARHEGALLHAAGASINGRGLIFPGKSGAGKSTLSQHLARRQGLAPLSDDRIAVRKTRGTFTAYGTPWAGDQGAALNSKVSPSGIYFLCHADTNAIVQLRAGQALERLLPVTSIPWYDHETMSRILLFCGDLLAHVPAFELHFKPGARVARLLEQLA